MGAEKPGLKEERPRDEIGPRGARGETEPGRNPQDERAVARARTAPYRLYGRRKGKPLRAGQQALLDDLLPRLRVALPATAGGLDPKRLFPAACRAVWLEIGFGGGEHLAAQAEAHPEIGLIGSEVYLNGVVKLLAAVARARTAVPPRHTIRIFPDDARLLIDALAPSSIGRVFILFPDPWPKTRHHRRRIVAPETLAALARVMAAGAELRLATDDLAYADAMIETLAAAARIFAGPAGGAPGLTERPPDWPPTRYEMKARAAGATPRYLLYRRI
jgi:tRNA (guanine-N7-)-methyltransferase